MSSKFNSAFRSWFGNSKVVNSQGKPQVVYHGTPNEFTEFKLPGGSLGIHVGTLAQAESVHSKNILPLYCRIERPVRLHDQGEWATWSVIRQLNRAGYEVEESGISSVDDLRRYMIEELRIDGVVYLNRFEGLSIPDIRKKAKDPRLADVIPDEEFFREFKSARDSWIALHSTQLKSANENDGSWTIDDPNLRSNPGDSWIDIARTELDIANMEAAQAHRKIINAKTKREASQAFKEHKAAIANAEKIRKRIRAMESLSKESR